MRTFYGWREVRALAVAKGMAASAFSLLTAWLIPFLKNEYGHSSVWLVVATPVALVLALGSLGLVSLLRMDSIHDSFIRATVWLKRFQ